MGGDPNSSPPCPRTQQQCKISGPECRGCGFQVPGHSHPVSGGLTCSAWGHHQVGRILAGRPGQACKGLEATARKEVEVQEGEAAILGTQCMCRSGHSSGSRGSPGRGLLGATGWALSRDPGVLLFPTRSKQSRVLFAPACPSHKPKSPSRKGRLPFISFPKSF